MSRSRILRFGFVFAFLSASAFGQQEVARFEALRQALGLTYSQMEQLQREKRYFSAGDRQSAPGIFANQSRSFDRGQNPPHIAIEEAIAERRARILDDSQLTKLEAIERVLDRYRDAAFAIALWLIPEERWPGVTLCLPPNVYLNLGNYGYGKELGITPEQAARFRYLRDDAHPPLWAQVKVRSTQRTQLLRSGAREDSAAVLQLESEIAELRAKAAARPRQDPAWTILDAEQQAKVEDLENQLQLAGEAVDLELIYTLVGGEVLCH